MSPWIKNISHWMKSRIYEAPRLDAWLEDHFTSDSGNQAYLRLFPERRHRPMTLQHKVSRSRRRLTILSLVPPEDTGGGSRPARLAEAFLRADWAVDWRWALPIFPWPSLRRPPTPSAAVHHLSENIPLLPSDLILVEAPHAAFLPLLENAPGDPCILYEQIDLWQGDLALGWFDTRVEKQLMERADFLSATSRVLCDGIEQMLARPCGYIPNAADVALFDPHKDWPRPVELRQGLPTLIYVGALWGDWVDLELIERLADELPRAQIHLLGRAGGRILPKRTNIHYLGEKPREAIPAFLQHADAALIPFRKSAVAAAVSPLKAFEALVMGCPLVSTPLPEMVAIPEVITATPDDFAATVSRMSQTRPSAEALARLRADSSWARRVESILDLTGQR